jgi:hypothetical protein
MQFPSAAANERLDDPYAIFPWHLETLVNEALVLPHISDRRGRSLSTITFETVHALSKLVYRIEEADDRQFLLGKDGLYEVHRLAQRQFEWQRGFANQPRFYRALQMFGQGSAGDYFERTVGCSVCEFIETAFYIFVGHSNSVSRNWATLGDVGGVSAALMARVLDHISIAPAEAKAMAKELRHGSGHAAYKPSILRLYPIIRFGTTNVDAISPLPPLILQRASSGLFLDIVGGGGPVWNDIGKRFEKYCINYLDAMLDGFEVEPEFLYGPKKHQIHTPDILVSHNQAVRLVVECKAKHMPIAARFSGNPVGDASDAYAEIAKGIFQIWRFRSHVRRGLFPNPVHQDCLGMVLTSDPWLVMGWKLDPEVMAIANRIADEKEPEIAACDRGRVPIVLIDDLEYHLQHGTAETLLQRLTELSADFTGWQRSLTHGLQVKTARPYPFSAALSEKLPRMFGGG